MLGQGERNDGFVNPEDTLDTRVDLNILKIQSNKLLLFGGKFAKSRNAH